jgi:hypothetical protein
VRRGRRAPVIAAYSEIQEFLEKSAEFWLVSVRSGARFLNFRRYLCDEVVVGVC